MTDRRPYSVVQLKPMPPEQCPGITIVLGDLAHLWRSSGPPPPSHEAVTLRAWCISHDRRSFA